MKVAFLGGTHAAIHLANAAKERGFELSAPDDAELIFVSMDTPTDSDGKRNTAPIRSLINREWGRAQPIIVTSQVEPGFMRALRRRHTPVFHQSETLRIKDAAHRALHPEMFIVGCHEPGAPLKSLPRAYLAYMLAFDCPILRMSYESAEYAKLAINAFLISQVETTNMLAKLARKAGADWGDVTRALKLDSRIGMEAYLTPGRWADSIHLKRDYVTLCEIAGTQPKRLLEAWA